MAGTIFWKKKTMQWRRLIKKESSENNVLLFFSVFWSYLKYETIFTEKLNPKIFWEKQTTSVWTDLIYANEFNLCLG